MDVKGLLWVAFMVSASFFVGFASYNESRYQDYVSIVSGCETDLEQHVYRSKDLCVMRDTLKEGAGAGAVPTKVIQQGIDTASLLSHNREDYAVIVEQIFHNLNKEGTASTFHWLPGHESAMMVWFNNYPKESTLKITAWSSANTFYDTYSISY